MNDLTQVSCSISTTDASAELGLEVWLDAELLLDCAHVTETIDFNHAFSNESAEHVLRLVLKNKQEQHTKIDLAGNIIEDARLIVKDLALEKIKLDSLFDKITYYTHDFNGSQLPIKDQFFGDIGCNGTVHLPFTTPIYQWLLERM
jgi:hypothetical protein